MHFYNFRIPFFCLNCQISTPKNSSIHMDASIMLCCSKLPPLSNFVTFGAPRASAFTWVAFLFTGKFLANLSAVEKHNILLLRRKTCAGLRARTCALFTANTKVAAFGRHHKGAGGLRPPFLPLARRERDSTYQDQYIDFGTRETCEIRSVG